jgi:hypothetical protein
MSQVQVSDNETEEEQQPSLDVLVKSLQYRNPLEKVKAKANMRLRSSAGRASNLDVLCMAGD